MFKEQPPKNDAPMLEWALYYARNGWAPIPVGVDKIPPIKWKSYKTTFPSFEEIREWWSEHPDANIAIVNGMISGLIILDIDVKNNGFESIKNFHVPPTVMDRSGGGGAHYFYHCPSGASFRQSIGSLGSGIDIPGYVIVAPSMHKSGNRYEWILPPWEEEMADAPDWLCENGKKSASEKKIDWNEFTETKNAEGKRNDQTTKYAGKILHDLSPELWERDGWMLVEHYNSTRNEPPLSKEEVRTIFDSIRTRDLKSKQNRQDISNVGSVWEKALTFNELITTEFSDPEWLVERIVPKNCITILSGPPGGYKSTLLSHLAISVASGSKFIESFNTAKTGVMIVDEENNARRTAAHIKELTDETDLPIYYRIKKGFKVTDKDMVNSLIQEAAENNVGLIIFDTLIRIHDLNENDAQNMSQIYKWLQCFTDAGITVVLAHHHRKQGQGKIATADTIGVSEMMRGSSDILGMVDSHLAIASITKEKNNDIEKQKIIGVQTKQRDAEPLGTFAIDIDRTDGRLIFTYGGEVEESAGVIHKLKPMILNILENDASGVSQKELEKQLNNIAKPTSVRDARKSLENENKIDSKTKSELKKIGIEKEDGSSNTLFYFLKQEVSTELIDPIFDNTPF